MPQMARDPRNTAKNQTDWEEVAARQFARLSPDIQDDWRELRAATLDQ